MNEFMNEYIAVHTEFKLLENYLPKYDIDNIILYSITTHDVKNYVCKKMMEYVV